MKKFLLSMLTIAITMIAMAQTTTEKEIGHWQIGAFGGLSLPMGTYKADTGRANTGYVGGIFIDKYFRGNNFGVGLDARFLQHGLRGYDSLFFQNGHIAATYNNPDRFRHFGLAVGPTYKFTANKFAFEAFAKGGVLLQQFPNYERTLEYTLSDPRDPNPVMQSLMVRQTANVEDKAFAWMGVGGVRFNYEVARNLSVFVQGDYLSTFGTKFAGKPSEFFIEERTLTQEITDKDYMEDPLIFFEESPVLKKTFTQALNIAAGIKYTFGKRRTVKPVPPTPTPEPVVEAVPQAIKKDVLVVVKDRQTGLALSGVTVSIAQDGKTYTSISNANGEAERITDAAQGTYSIVGEKNGIPTAMANITPADFEQGGNIIYKEIFHDDPRFTLIGETVECETNTKIAGINTTLTHSGNAQNMGQVSDAEGKFIYQLEQQADYHVVANQAGKYSQTEQVSTRGLDRSKTLYVTLKLGVCELVEGANWVLKNIHYDFDKSDIRRDAALILDNVVNIMKENTTLRIELSSHTDSRGNDAYNKSLSQRRAEAAVSYLVSKGIGRDRMVARGYGETRLLNDCGNGVECSEEEHQQNRRTEIKVLNY